MTVYFSSLHAHGQVNLIILGMVKNVRSPVRLILLPPARAFPEVILSKEGLVVGVVVQSKQLRLIPRQRDRLDVVALRVLPRHLPAGIAGGVPLRHLALDVRDELSPRAPGDGVRAPALGGAPAARGSSEAAAEELADVADLVADLALALEDVVGAYLLIE